MTRLLKGIVAFLICVGTLIFGFAAFAQTGSGYPDRRVRVVNPSSPGGGADVISRILMQELSKSLGQNFLVDNRPGAANIIATEIALKSPADGYTLLIAATGTFVTNPLIYAKLPYSIGDFETISIVADAPFLLCVHPSVPANTPSELIALAKSQPGQLSYASFGIGSSSHLAGELFQSLTGTRLIHVPYKGSAPGMADVVAGRITMTLDSGLASTPHIQGNRVRALGVAAPKRLPSLPNVPTLAEAGLPNFYAGSWYGVMAPAGTPREIVTKLHGAIVRALRTPEVAKRITDLGAAVIGNTPEEFSALIGRERAQWAAVVQNAGVKPE